MLRMDTDQFIVLAGADMTCPDAEANIADERDARWKSS
jgi:hypothetical protein